jgi:hypothetical protein
LALGSTEEQGGEKTHSLLHQLKNFLIANQDHARDPADTTGFNELNKRFLDYKDKEDAEECLKKGRE